MKEKLQEIENKIGATSFQSNRIELIVIKDGCGLCSFVRGYDEFLGSLYESQAFFVFDDMKPPIHRREFNAITIKKKCHSRCLSPLSSSSASSSASLRFFFILYLR